VQKDVTSEEWAFNLWTDSRDWCVQCNQKNNKLVFDDQTKTTTCTQCGYAQTYTDRDWKNLQTQRYVTYQYMPGKYFFNSSLTGEEIFKKYLRELNHVDWSSWLIHDYVLAKMKADKTIQDKLVETAKLTVEKMNYDPKTWKTLFEKMDAQDPEIFQQVPQILYEFAEKKFQENTSKEDLPAIMEGYVANLSSMYSFNRWKGNRVTCWILSELIKLCDFDSYSVEFYIELFYCDPLLEGFQDDILAGKNREISPKDSYIQWELRLADKFLSQSKALGAVRAAYNALTAKLGIHDLWPTTKIINFDIQTVEKVTNLVNDPELFRFYSTAVSLDAIDTAKAGYYAKYFIDTVKEMLPRLNSVEQELAKQFAYIS
jgi:Zn ribbon nucleic-acid-binding protein